MKKLTLILALIITATLMVGCGTAPPIIGNNPPVITSTAVTEAEIGVEYIYAVMANDPDGDALTYSLTRKPGGMVIDGNTGAINWTPISTGNFGVTVKVTDGVLYDTQLFTIVITPITWLTGITVIPDIMNLEVGQTETFAVAANYNYGPDADVTGACVYTQPVTGIVSVTAGEVLAVEAGTDTVLISYTEGEITETINIACTVIPVPIPMELIANLPTFTTNEPYWFTISMVANDDAGKSATMSLPVGSEMMDYLEMQEGSTLTFDGSIFTVEDATSNIRGTFPLPGDYNVTMEVRESPSNDLLCSKSIVLHVTGDPLREIGDSFGGGIIAYLDGTGQHGLIMATDDQSTGMQWYNGSYVVTGATGTAIGTGQANTTAIVSVQGAGSYAAQLCDDLIVGSYDDWFLPSKDELGELYLNRVILGLSLEYWSSSESSFENAWSKPFTSASWFESPKDMLARVRAVRVF